MKLDLKESRRSAPTSTPRRSATTRSGPRAGSASSTTRSSTRTKSRRWPRPACKRLAGHAASDGGWGWFSGWGEHSWPHTTAVVVHGLQIAKAERRRPAPGHARTRRRWLKNYQAEQVQLLKNAPSQDQARTRSIADNLDALVYMVLVDAGVRQRPTCATSSTATAPIWRSTPRRCSAWPAQAAAGREAGHDPQEHRAVRRAGRREPDGLPASCRNERSGGTGTAARSRPTPITSSCWPGPIPKDEKASRLVKYLLNNRKHATYWNSTRDTAFCIEALAEYLRPAARTSPT